MKVVIDHIHGSRRGQRQELDADRRVRFGRHPDCEVSFDATRDIDASSRHAELRPPGAGAEHWTLVDVGSSNGTFLDGKRVTEAAIARGQPATVEFGPNGPTLRLFVGDDAEVLALAPVPALPEAAPRRSFALLIVVALLVLVGVVVVLSLL